MDGFEGLTMPGRCQNCGKNGPRFSFRNTYAEPEIHMDLCPRCMDTALHAVHIFRQTPEEETPARYRLTFSRMKDGQRAAIRDSMPRQVCGRAG